MAKFIQIEELVYGRLPHVSKSDWINMLMKGGMSAEYTTFKDDYLLLEQSDYRFDNDKMISSERVVYNIDYATYDIAENAPDPENTDEIQIVRYDQRTDRYFVCYAHYIPSNEPSPDTSYVLTESDIPSSRPSIQAPPEKQNDTPVIRPSVRPTPAPKPTPVVQEYTEVKKKWRRIDELRAAYKAGKTLEQIVAQFDCTKEGAIYQLKTYCGIEHPFEAVKKVSEEELYKKKWTKAEDHKLLQTFLSQMRFEEISNLIGHSVPEIRARLYLLIGLHNPFDASMDSRSMDEIKEAVERRTRWQKYGLEILLRKEYEISFQKDARLHKAIRRKAENEKLKVNGFYPPGTQVDHPVWGTITVIKDDERVLKYVTLEGAIKTVRK